MTVPAKFIINQYGTTEEHRSNILSALARGLPELSPALCSHDGSLVIVGSGPSLPACLEELKGERAKGRPILSLKGTHDYLIENGIEPNLWLTIDSRPRLNQLQKKTENTIYLVASRCHPDIFERLKDERVILWHSSASQDGADDIWVEKGKTVLGGGTTSGTRAIFVGYYMGFRNFVLYGMDSCNAEDGITKRFDGSLTGPTIEVRTGYHVGKESRVNNGRTFICNQAMAQQGNDFIMTLKMMPDAKFDIKGDGLLKAIYEDHLYAVQQAKEKAA
jgi:uncharacterized Rossmann fold enzyme